MSGNHPSQLSPRQRMINMMYLVLTALLALNVSKEVLNSFFEVNLGIVKTTESLEKKSSETYASLMNVKDTAKSSPYIELTNKIKPEADNIVLFIQEMKYNLVSEADGGKVYLGYYDNGAKDEENNKYLKEDVSFSDLDQNERSDKIAYLNAKDDRHASGDVFNPENKSNLPNVDGVGFSTRLKNNILEYRDLLLNILETARDNGLVPNNGAISSLIMEIKESLDIKDGAEYGEKGNKRTWEHHNFYDMPAVGAHTILSKWQADIRNIESEVVSFLVNNVTSKDYKVDRLSAVANATSTYVTSGDEFSAEIFVSASSSTMTPEIYMGPFEEVSPGIYKSLSNDPPLELVNGRGTYKRMTGRNEKGIKIYEGFIKLPQEGGDFYESFEKSYTVAPPSSAVSPDHMLAMFNGYDNPITVSAAGQDMKDVSITLSQGTKTGRNGSFIVKPSKLGKLMVTVYGIDSKKKRIRIGSTEFQVHPVPSLSPQLRPGIDPKGTTKDKLITLRWPLTYVVPSIVKKFEGIKFGDIIFEVVLEHANGHTEPPVSNVTNFEAGKGYNLIDGAKPGETIIIRNIKYKRNGQLQNTQLGMQYPITIK